MHGAVFLTNPPVNTALHRTRESLVMSVFDDLGSRLHRALDT